MPHDIMAQKVYTKTQALPKIAKFCAYQERTQQEVRDKLYAYGLYGDEVEDLICTLIEENFINEERFAKAYAGGKFRLKKWGRIKIERGLKEKGISKYCIQQGLKEIEEETYQQTLEELLAKKYPQIKGENSYIRKSKLANFAIAKGYETYLVWQIIKENY